MDNQLYDELMIYIENTLIEKENPRDVIRTLTELINFIAEWYVTDNYER